MSADNIDIFVVLGQPIDLIKSGYESKFNDYSNQTGRSYINSLKLVDSDLFTTKKLSLSKKTKVGELIDASGLQRYFTQEGVPNSLTYSYGVRRSQLNENLYHAGFLENEDVVNEDEATKHHDTTLENLNILDGEVLILNPITIRKKSTGLILKNSVFVVPPRDLLEMIDDDLRVRDRNLEMFLLYTDADTDLARFVRESYADLNFLSGRRIQVYALENFVTESSLAAYLKYWRSVLSEKLYLVWSSLGWLSTKPYDKTQCYEIGKRLGVSPEHFPCVVLFDQPIPENALIFPINQPYIDFFRVLFAELHNVISSVAEENKQPYLEDVPEEADLSRYYRKDAFKKQEELYKSVKQDYSKIKEKVVSVSKRRNVSEFTFYGKTVFINNPTGSVELNNFQND